MSDKLTILSDELTFSILFNYFDIFHSRLKSTLFSSDDEVHGESEERLSKSETFNGREFGLQFGLRFHDQFKEGIFGKVAVSRSEGDGTSKDVAEFLLQKVTIFSLFVP